MFGQLYMLLENTNLNVERSAPEPVKSALPYRNHLVSGRSLFKLLKIDFAVI